MGCRRPVRQGALHISHGVAATRRMSDGRRGKAAGAVVGRRLVAPRDFHSSKTLTGAGCASVVETHS
eukprot:22146-Eustigmatos_ZCMA.PRE.1